jgi:hypothetical protein
MLALKRKTCIEQSKVRLIRKARILIGTSLIVSCAACCLGLVIHNLFPCLIVLAMLALLLAFSFANHSYKSLRQFYQESPNDVSVTTFDSELAQHLNEQNEAHDLAFLRSEILEERSSIELTQRIRKVKRVTEHKQKQQSLSQLLKDLDAVFDARLAALERAMILDSEKSRNKIESQLQSLDNQLERQS